jgi:hypothetical protein
LSESVDSEVAERSSKHAGGVDGVLGKAVSPNNIGGSTENSDEGTSSVKVGGAAGGVDVARCSDGAGVATDSFCTLSMIAGVFTTVGSLYCGFADIEYSGRDELLWYDGAGKMGAAVRSR